jgi:hypothetical protein
LLLPLPVLTVAQPAAMLHPISCNSHICQ